MADFILGRLKFKWKGPWVTGTAYIIDDIVKYGANTYTCIVNHTADASFYTDLDTNSYWSLHTESFHYDTTSPNWTAGTAYKLNDVVRWGSNLYLCKTQHTASSDSASGFVTDSSNWILFVPGLEFEDSYVNSKQYQSGDVVTYGGYVYTAIQDTKENLPTDTANWEIVTTGFSTQGDYNSGTTYKPGSVVRVNGYTYVAKVDTTGNSPTVQDGDSNSPTYNKTIVNSTYWDQLNSGFKFIGDWADSTKYYLGDIVKETNSSYVCIDEHTGDGNATTKPPNTTFWETLAAGDTQIVMNSPGDIMIRTSTNVALNVGPKGWKLRADEGQGHPVHWDPDDESYTWYVDANKGVDEENLFYSPGGGTTTADYSSTATYLAGQVARWAPPAWTNGGTYTVGEMVSHIDSAATPVTMEWFKCKDTTDADTTAPMTNGVVGAPWVKISPSGPVAQTTAKDPNNVHVFYGKDRLYGKNDSTTTSNYNSSAMMYKVYMAIKERVGVEPVNAETGVINEGWREVLNGIKTDSDGHATGVVTWGKNPSSCFKTIRYACARARSGDQIMCAPGVYKEHLPITIPAGVSIQGKEMRTTFVEPNMEDDGGNGVGISTLGGGKPNNEVAMFYCNDATTVRGFTFRGLTGTVLGVGNPHTEPTVKGVCFQLDPNGAINLKSPFIQNCCAINDGGGGIYCDGNDAPNGNYQSFTTNDFTQINSNGFGLFATNKGRIEAVSVFTYYCRVGYTTTHGGIIRSANGNNSYGDYGSVSEGHYANELNLTQKTGQIDNRTGEAVPYRVVVNESTGQVQRIEWSYAGESYTSATVSITAAGDNDAGTPAAGGSAEFSATYMNGGICRIDMINNVSNLNRYTGNAQGGTNPTTGDATITLTATNNTIPDDQINGMVCNILSGTGGGQWGIIKDYDNASKLATIDGQWTSMSGSATAVPDTTSVYEIEPRVTLSGGSTPTREAYVRCQVSSLADIEQLLIIDPGEGYDANNLPTTVTIVDPTLTSGSQTVNSTIRVKDGVPYWSRTAAGGGYPTGMTSGQTTPGTTVATVSGDGFAEVPQTGSYLYVKGLQREPKDGSNLEISGDTTYYQIVNTLGYTNSGGSNGTARLQISPSMTVAKAPIHEASLQFREEYSSCRLTGHDFLDIGTGTFVTSNYPGVPTQAANPTHETQGHCGGRVFFTSTDQDGNFSVGGLFSVQQATGTATLNAEQFSLNGLQQLKLGALQFAGYGATIDEFSTDGTLSGNSDNALVTEKAIKTYITNQLGGGENALEVNTATIGTVDISANTISTTTASAHDLVLKSTGGKVQFDTASGEPTYDGTVTTENTLISRGYFEDNFVTQQLISNIMNTLDNDRVAGTGDPSSP